MRLTFQVFGEEQINRELVRFRGRIVNAEPAFASIVDDLKDTIDEQFESEGRSGSGGWAPIKPATIARKAALGRDTRILHETLRLRESLTDAANSDQIREIDHLGFTFGTTVPYAIFHQRGTEHMPARPPIDISEGDRQQFVKILQRYIVTGELVSGQLL